MEPFIIAYIIALCIAISIFIVTSIVVFICRRKKQNRFPGQVFTAPQAMDTATATVPDGYTVAQLPTSYGATGQQTQVYAVSYPTQGAPQQMSMPLPQGQAPAPGLPANNTLYPSMTANEKPPSYGMDTTTADSVQPNTST